MNELVEVFVIMPFSRTPTRSKEDLDEFFLCNLRDAIEKHQGFSKRYRVTRSDDSFNIGKKVVEDLYRAEIVLCDLSGQESNPNVMYELGLRLALTNKPVIMFREKHPDNKQIFDISVFHTKEYSVTRYRELEDYITSKILKYESGSEIFRSPVLEILGTEPSVVREIELFRAKGLLEAIYKSLMGLLRGLTGHLSLHLRSIAPNIEIPRDSRELSNFLFEQEDLLASLEWNNFDFLPALPPSLSSYLSNFPLSGSVDNWISDLWNTVLTEYYNLFFATNFNWKFAQYSSIRNFVIETTVVRMALWDLILYLRESGSVLDRSSHLQDMLDKLRNFAYFDDEIIDELRKKI